MKLLLVAGARPNFMKVAPLIHAIRRHNSAVLSKRSEDRAVASREGGNPQPSTLNFSLVHTGQHYDAAMSDVFFQELGIPAPNHNLGVGSGSHAVQTASVMVGFEKVCLTEKPDWIIVVGDVNSTVACTLVGVKMGIKVAHVEAGLRSFDRTMPEEINRLVTDSIADLLLTPSKDANENLRREGVAEARIRLVGNIMIDSLIANLPQASESKVLERCAVECGEFVYVTLHRPSNVDHRENLSAILSHLRHLSDQFPIVFPIHPRTRKMIAEFGLNISGNNGFRIVDPVGYHDSVALTQNARLVLTDSGGLQEEATYFRTPCLTLRPNTERPITVTVGSNLLTSPEKLEKDLADVLSKPKRIGSIPPMWDGGAANRIIDALVA